MHTSPGETVSVGFGCPGVGRVRPTCRLLRVEGHRLSAKRTHQSSVPDLKSKSFRAFGPSSASAPLRFRSGQSLRAEQSSRTKTEQSSAVKCKTRGITARKIKFCT